MVAPLRWGFNGRLRPGRRPSDQGGHIPSRHSEDHTWQQNDESAGINSGRAAVKDNDKLLLFQLNSSEEFPPCGSFLTYRSRVDEESLKIPPPRPRSPSCSFTMLGGQGSSAVPFAPPDVVRYHSPEHKQAPLYLGRSSTEKLFVALLLLAAGGTSSDSQLHCRRRRRRLMTCEVCFTALYPVNAN